MRFAPILTGTLAVVCFGLIVSHLLGLPRYSVGGWIAESRITKTAAFIVSSPPSDVTEYSWTSLWGPNRPTEGRPHEILSELEVVVQHETRSGHVTVRITGDTEAEVDGFIETLNRDFERTYRQSDSIHDPLQKSHFD